MLIENYAFDIVFKISKWYFRYSGTSPRLYIKNKCQILKCPGSEGSQHNFYNVFKCNKADAENLDVEVAKQNTCDSTVFAIQPIKSVKSTQNMFNQNANECLSEIYRNNASMVSHPSAQQQLHLEKHNYNSNYAEDYSRNKLQTDQYQKKEKNPAIRVILDKFFFYNCRL